MQVGIFDIFLALVPMGPILVSIDATFSRNQYQREYPYGVIRKCVPWLHLFHLRLCVTLFEVLHVNFISKKFILRNVCMFPNFVYV